MINSLGKWTETLLWTPSPLRYLSGECINSNVSVHLLSALIIIGWTFMHEVNILPPPSIARFFLTQQLIYRSKIKKHNACLDIFVSDTSIDRNPHLPGLGKKHFSYIMDTYSFFGSESSIRVAQNQKSFEDQDLIVEVKKYLQWSMIGKIIPIAYGKNASGAKPCLLASAIRFIYIL